jgi:uncharacterized protein (TIGR02145 family)
MKNKISHSVLIAIGIIIIIAIPDISCKKDKPVALPELSTSRFSNLTSTSVISGGDITSDGGAAVTSRGVCWGTAFEPTLADNSTIDGGGTGSFTSLLTGLISGTQYYVRAYATNNAGTAYGNQFLLMTPAIDIDGNVYKTVKIGDQSWMCENLKTTKFNDNTPISKVTNNLNWSQLSTPAYCWYNNDEASNKPDYGALYNWFAVNTYQLCPTGWHVPSEKEWTTLTDNLGGENIAGNVLKEIGLTHWREMNFGASDSYGFSALPGGRRTGLSSGVFRAKGYLGWWWASTESDSTGARARQMTYEYGYIARGTGLKKNGYSVRCIKDLYY